MTSAARARRRLDELAGRPTESASDPGSASCRANLPFWSTYAVIWTFSPTGVTTMQFCRVRGALVQLHRLPVVQHVRQLDLRQVVRRIARSEQQGDREEGPERLAVARR